MNLPAGKITHGSQERVVRTVGKLRTAEGIARVIVRSNSDGKHIRIADLGSVSRTFEEDDIYLNVNGGRALLLGVKKTDSGDTIDIADAVKALVAEEQARLGDRIRLDIVNDLSFYVKRRLNILMSNGIIGMLLMMRCDLLSQSFSGSALVCRARKVIGGNAETFLPAVRGRDALVSALPQTFAHRASPLNHHARTRTVAAKYNSMPVVRRRLAAGHKRYACQEDDSCYVDSDHGFTSHIKWKMEK